MHPAKPDFARARKARWQKGQPALVDGHRVKAELQVCARQRQVMAEVQDFVPEIGEPECGDDIKEPQEADLGRVSHLLASGRILNAVVEKVVDEVQRGRSPTAETDDV